MGSCPSCPEQPIKVCETCQTCDTETCASTSCKTPALADPSAAAAATSDKKVCRSAEWTDEYGNSHPLHYMDETSNFYPYVQKEIDNHATEERAYPRTVHLEVKDKGEQYGWYPEGYPKYSKCPKGSWGVPQGILVSNNNTVMYKAFVCCPPGGCP